MVEKQISHFDLRQIAESGQCFRMTELSRDIPADYSFMEAHAGSRLSETDNGLALEPVRYAVTASDRYVEVEQEGDWFRFFCEEQEFEQFWSHYFDLETDYGQFIARIGKRDRYLRQAADFGGGIRILNQDLWEVMVTFLISQNNHMKRIRQCVERLCEHFGEKCGTAGGKCYYAMPGPEALSDIEALKDMGLGYRDKYIAALAAAVAEGAVDLERLRGLKGFPMGRYKGCAGVMQQYMFYYEVSSKMRQ